MTYSGAERECEKSDFADGHCGYLSLKKEFELWVSHREEINQTVQSRARKTASTPISCRRERFTGRRAATSSMLCD